MTTEVPFSTDFLQSPERPLAGKTAIVTGGSRDIGAEIVRSLTREGVKVVFSYRNKGPRAEEVIEKVTAAGGQASAIASDMSTPVGRSAFFESALETLGGLVDFLVLSSSGQTAGHNIELSNHMLDLTLPHMTSGSAVVKLQSVPGHFAPQLEGAFAGGAYEAVAANKYPDLKALRKRMPQMAEHGIRFVEICPPVVADTSNARIFGRRIPGIVDLHYEVTDKLGLPRDVAAANVGDKIAELLSKPDLPSGYTEFFGNVSDVQTPLERIYGIPQIYVSTLEMEDDIEGEKRGIGRTIISLKQATRPNEPKMVDGVEVIAGNVVGKLHVTSEHAVGHFTQESGLPQILPGHKQIRAAVDTIGAIEKTMRKNNNGVRLVGFESAVFSSIILANGNTDLLIIPTQKSDGTYDVEILRESNGERTAFIRGLRVRPETEADKDTLLEDQVIEGAAQTAGVVGLQSLNGDSVPLLLEIGKTEFVAGGIKAGQGIKYKATTVQTGKRITESSIEISSEGRDIGTVSGLRATLISTALASRLVRK